MTALNWVFPRDRRRAEVEGFVRGVYAARYGARIAAFPTRIAARFSPDGAALCAAGLRTATDGFFSEGYLDVSVERRLEALTGAAVARAAVFEVTTLASLSPLATAAFIQQLAAHGEAAGFDWAFCTLTGTLRFLLERQHLQPIFLAPADPARLPGAADWGAYYAQDPMVCAVASARLAGLRPPRREGVHAAAC